MDQEFIEGISDVVLIIANIIDENGIKKTKPIKTSQLPSNYLIYANKNGEVYIFDDGTKKTLITEETYKKLCARFSPKKKAEFWKTLLAILIMIVTTVVVILIGTLSLMFAYWLFDGFYQFKIWAKAIWIILFGPMAVSALLGVPLYGAMFVVSLSNKIKKSENGLRFIMFGVFVILLYAVNLVASIYFGEGIIPSIIMILFGGAVIIYSKTGEFSE